jgi:hypothetical protein
MATKRRASAAASRTATQHRKIQRQVAHADRRSPKIKQRGAMQAGARRYPEPPLPRQHLPKPGHEAVLNPPLTLAYDDRAERLALHAGTLDQPGQFAPISHCGVESRLGWVDCGTGPPEKATAERW